MGNSYKPTSIDLGSGSGTVGGGSPRRPGAASGNRHCAAWEQVQAALNIIADCMDLQGCPQAGEVRALAAGAKMERNRGE